MPASLKKTSGVALSAIFVLLIGAVVFYQERVLFSDSSYILFNIINYKSLSIQEHRYGSFITQIVPFIGQKLHLPLKAILVSYSISFDLFYLVVASLLVFRYRQYGLAILMALYYFLFVSDSYFWTIDEIHQAVAWMFLLFGVTLHLGYKKVNTALLLIPFLLLAFLTVTTHFIVIIPTVFLWVYLIIEKEHWPFTRITTISLSIILVAIVGVKSAMAAISQTYDSDHLHGLTHFSLQDVINSFTTPVLKVFVYKCLVNYWLAVGIFIAGVIALIKSKQKLLAAWTIISCLGYVILMGLIYGDLDSNVLSFHIETEWQCIGIIIAAPFVFTVLPKLKTSRAIAALTFIFIIRLAYIGAAIPTFTWRTHFQKEILAQMQRKNITKLALYDDLPELRSKYLLNWCAGYESLFTSAIDGDKPNRTFIFINKDDKQKINLISDAKGFYNVWGVLPYESTNRDYFTIDTAHTYQIMSYQELSH